MPRSLCSQLHHSINLLQTYTDLAGREDVRFIVVRLFVAGRSAYTELNFIVLLHKVCLAKFLHSKNRPQRLLNKQTLFEENLSVRTSRLIFTFDLYTGDFSRSRQWDDLTGCGMESAGHADLRIVAENVHKIIVPLLLIDDKWTRFFFRHFDKSTVVKKRRRKFVCLSARWSRHSNPCAGRQHVEWENPLEKSLKLIDISKSINISAWYITYARVMSIGNTIAYLESKHITALFIVSVSKVACVIVKCLRGIERKKVREVTANVYWTNVKPLHLMCLWEICANRLNAVLVTTGKDMYKRITRSTSKKQISFWIIMQIL